MGAMRAFFHKLMRYVLPCGLAVGVTGASAQMPEPDKWVSMVPEGAMGTVISMYMPSANPAMTVTLQCAGLAPWLEIGVNDAVLRQVLGELGPRDPIFFRVGGLIKQYEPYNEAQAWQLRARGENFPMPVAQVATMENGSTFGLFCDQQGKPAAYFAGPVPTPGSVIDAIVDGQAFAFNAVPFETHLIFFMSRDFLAAVQSGRDVKMSARGQFQVTFSLRGSTAGAAHAYAGCGAPVY